MKDWSDETLEFNIGMILDKCNGDPLPFLVEMIGEKLRRAEEEYDEV